MKIYRSIFLVIFISLILFPFGTMMFFIKETKHDYLQYVKREAMSIEEIQEKSFFKKPEAVASYLQQHAAKRRIMMNGWTRLLYTLNVSTVDLAVVGRDKTLFHTYYLSEHRGFNTFTDDSVVSAIDNVTRISDYCRAHNAEFVLFIAPNKATVYPELLPVWFSSTSAPTFIMRFNTAYSADAQRFNYINIFDDIISQKYAYGTLLYPKCDTHWNDVAGYIAFNKILTAQNTLYSIPKMTGYKTQQVEQMNLVEVLGLNTATYKEDTLVSIGEFTSDYKKEMLLDQNLASPNFCLHNSKAMNDITVLLLRDSFSDAMLKYYYAAFSTVYVVHYKDALLFPKQDNLFLPSLLEETHPDLVVLESVDHDFIQFGMLSEDFLSSLDTEPRVEETQR